MGWSPTARSPVKINPQTVSAIARLQLQLGHSMSSMAYSPDGQTIASSGDRTVKLWDALTGRLRVTLEGHWDTVQTVAFSPDGRTLVSGSQATIRLWDAETGILRTEWKSRDGNLLTICFSPDGRTLAVGNGDRIELWKLSEGRPESYLVGHDGNVWSVVYSADGQTIASGSDDGTIKLWAASSGRLLRTIAVGLGRIYSVTLSPDGRMIVCGGQDKRVRLWDASDGRLLRVLEGHSDSVYAVVFSRDGKLLVSGSNDRTIKLWDPSSGELRDTIQRSSWFGRPLALSPNGRLLASSGADGTVHQWNLRTKQLEFSPPGDYGTVSQLTFSPDAKTIGWLRYGLFGGKYLSKLMLWGVGQGKPPVILSQGADNVWAMAFSPDGRTLAAGTTKSLELWDVESGILRKSIDHHSTPITSVTYISGSKYVLTLDDRKNGELWDLQHANLIASLKAAIDPYGGVNARSYWVEGTSTVSLDSKSVNLSDAPIRRPPPATNSLPDDFTRVDWSPASEKIAAAVGSSTAGIWNADNGRKLATLVGHTGLITTVLFSPDGRTLATGSRDNTVRVWDTGTGDLRGIFRGHFASIDALMFTPDGKTVVSRSTDGTTRVWETDSLSIDATVVGYERDGSDAAFSSDGKILAHVPGFNEPGFTRKEARQVIQLIDTQTGQLRTTLRGHGSTWPFHVSFSPDGSFVAVGSADRSLKLWDASTGKLLASTPTYGDVESVAFSPGGQFLVSGDKSGAIKLWTLSFIAGKKAEMRLSPSEQLDGVSTRLLCTLVAFPQHGWVVVTPDGRFDASTPWNSLGAHWVLGTRIIPLDGLRKHGYSHGLLRRIWRSAGDRSITYRP
jgi:WD40 repeat protein